MKNRYWLIDQASLNTALEKGETTSLLPHNKPHYSPLANGKHIIQANYTDEEMDFFRLKPWAFLHGRHNFAGSPSLEGNYFSNPYFHSGDTGWVLGTGYSVDNNNNLLWDSEGDTTAVAYQDITVLANTILKFTFSYLFQMDDIANIPSATSSDSLRTARIVIKNSSDLSTLATFYTGDTDGQWEKRSFLFKSSVTGLRIEIMGRRAGVGRWKGFSCLEFVPTTHGRYKSPILSLPSYKGGNFGTFLNNQGSNIINTWLSSSNYTTANKNAWRNALENMYLANGLNVCRMSFSCPGNYSTEQNMFNSDWSGLNTTESNNLEDFMENVVPDGLKIIPVLVRNTSFPASVFNTELTPNPTHQTQDNFFGRIGEILDILIPFKSKIAMWEISGEIDSQLSESVSYQNIYNYLVRFYDLVKTKDIIVPVCVSYNNQDIYMYHSLLIEGTADIISRHFYGQTPIFSNSSNPLATLPDVMQLPCVMGEGRHVDGGSDPEVNEPYLEEANNIYYALGFEGFYPWTIKGYGGDNGSSALDLDWNEDEGDSYIKNG